MVPRPSAKIAAHVAQTLGGRLDGAHVLTTVHNTALEMMQDRGLTVVDSCVSEAQLLQRIDDVAPLLCAQSADGAARTLVFFDADERTGVKLVRSLREQHAGAALCVVNVDGPTPFTKREFATSEDVEFWQANDLLCNPTRHALVPRHVALTADETERLQADRCVLPRQWPSILATDIIVRWYRFPKGAVLRIERSGLAHESSNYFRKVE